MTKREHSAAGPRFHSFFAFMAGLVLVFAAAFSGISAFAQSSSSPASSPPPPPLAEDPVMMASRAAFEALPETRRREIQDALVWAGIYKGSVDGTFGRMTHQAIQTWLSRQAGKPQQLDAAHIAALQGQAAKARAAAAFARVAEARAGVGIGIPAKIFTRRTQMPGGMRYETADRSATIETFRVNDLNGGLKALFDAYAAPVEGRRITYRVLRPDFFVITSETANGASYTRVGAPQAEKNILRGFTMTWQKKQRARYETLVIAVANSFEPAPGAPASAAPVAAAPAPPQRQIAATALAFSGERFVAVLAQASCPSPRIGPWPARILRRDEKSGLTLIDADGAKGRRVQLPAGETPAGASAVVFFADGAAEKPVIVASAGEVGAQPPLRFIGALPVHANGAILVARNGAILGLAGSAPAAARKLASATNAIAIPPQSRELIPVSAVKDFAFSAGLEFLPAQANAAPQSAGALAVALEGSLFALTCAR